MDGRFYSSCFHKSTHVLWKAVIAAVRSVAARSAEEIFTYPHCRAHLLLITAEPFITVLLKQL